MGFLLVSFHSILAKIFTTAVYRGLCRRFRMEGRKSNLPVALEADVGYGVRIGGVPVGDDQFMLNFVRRVTSGVCGASSISEAAVG